MTQTVNGRKGTPPPQKQYRPGQRQQERLSREARRRRRRIVISASLLGMVLIVLAGIGIWQYPHVVALFQKPPAKARKHINVISTSCSVATTSSSLYTPTPKAGPAAPPTVTTTPATLAGWQRAARSLIVLLIDTRKHSIYCLVRSRLSRGGSKD